VISHFNLSVDTEGGVSCDHLGLKVGGEGQAEVLIKLSETEETLVSQHRHGQSNSRPCWL
jgi:hypothetical protein